MKKLISDYNWMHCSLCGKLIRKGEEYFIIKWQDKVGYSKRYRTDNWHTKHFKFADYSKRCKKKMDCITNQQPIHCIKKLCIHNRS